MNATVEVGVRRVGNCALAKIPVPMHPKATATRTWTAGIIAASVGLDRGRIVVARRLVRATQCLHFSVVKPKDFCLRQGAIPQPEIIEFAFIKSRNGPEFFANVERFGVATPNLGYRTR